MMSCVGSKSRSPGPQLIRVNFESPNVLTSIPGFREITGNLSPDSLGVIIRRPLDREDMRLLDFRPNPMLLAEAFGKGMKSMMKGWGVDSHERWGEGPYAQDLISDLEADITACWEELQVRMREPLPLFTKPQVPINQPIIYNQPATLASINQHSMYNQPANLVPIYQPSMYNQPATLVPINQPVQNQPANQVPINQPVQNQPANLVPIYQPSMYNQPATLVPINQPVQNQPANPVPINPPSLPNQQATLALINPPVIPSLPIALLPATTPNPATRDVITRIPKTLQFDGRSNWPVFRGKFERYANLHQWSDDECADGLVWCLVGKAADFYAVLTDGRKTVPYKELLHRLEERFDAKELPATAQGRFQAISQGWSDRVLTLATKAFRDLPQTYATEQAVAKFCYGLHDKEARLQSIGEAIEKIRMFHHIQFACAPTQETEQEESRWVHEVKKAPTADEVSVSAVDKLTQVVEKLLDAVERLSNSFGSSAVDPVVRQPGKPSGTGGTTTNARLCILRVWVAEVYVGIGTKIQKSALRDRIAADMVPTGDISMPSRCVGPTGSGSCKPARSGFPDVHDACQMSSVIQGWSLARALKETMEILCAMMHFAYNGCTGSLRKQPAERRQKLPREGKLARQLERWPGRPLEIEPNRPSDMWIRLMSLRRTAGSVRPDTESPRVTTEGSAHPDTELPRTKEGRMNFEGLLGRWKLGWRPPELSLVVTLKAAAVVVVVVVEVVVVVVVVAEVVVVVVVVVVVKAYAEYKIPFESLSFLPWVRLYDYHDGGGPRGEKWEECNVAQKERSDESWPACRPDFEGHYYFIGEKWEECCATTNRYICTVSCARDVEFQGCLASVTVYYVFAWKLPFRDVDEPTSVPDEPTSVPDEPTSVPDEPTREADKFPRRRRGRLVPSRRGFQSMPM
ncbi:hypothetical protein DPMN_162671 [Dreissena polymorpha]|uniref:Uncharacterized protein n=1 Tax=Dreissena polymorpha TaxID=45954 RepID=A0A9D4EQX1_DREPO|nr:hypothetical protein DPMN_162671 [Dreissena polymorpha]